MRKILVPVGILLVIGVVVTVLASPHQQSFDRFEATWVNTDFSKSSVDPSEIRSGGVGRDQIAPYYPEGYVYPERIPGLGGRTPRYTVSYTDVATTDAYLPDESPVISVAVDGEYRAYPLLLLNNHEIVNTEIAGVPLAVTFCPLCNASIVFERVVNERELHFGVSGLLRNSDLIMWDHETESWWQQFTGDAIVGEMTGTELELVPSLVVSWGEFKAEHPDAKVLENLAGHRADYVSYTGYDERGDPFLYTGDVDARLPATERVLGYFGREGAIAYPFSTLSEVVVVNDQIGDEPAVVFWQSGANSLFTIEMETGSAALYRATLEDGTVLTFTAEDGVIMDEQTGSTWNVFGRAVEGELTGTKLRQYFAYPHFWFAWAAFRPDTLVWEPGMIADAAWADVEE